MAMDLENPDCVTRYVIRRIDPAVFYWIFCCFRTLIFVLDSILDTLIGYTITKGWRAERERSEAEYEHSAQLCSIMARGTYTIIKNHKLHNFCCKHEEYVHPRYVLEHDNVTLFGVTATHAFFCVSKPDFNVYETRAAPFLFIIHFFAAQQLVVMPLSSFHRLADELGDPKDREMTFINMTTRCGSTLLSCMLARVPRVRVMSEPWSFVHSHGLLIQGKVDMDGYRRLVRSCVRVQTKAENNNNMDHVVIKMTNLVSPMFSILKEFYPNANFIFNSRHLKPTIVSFKKIVNSLPTVARYAGIAEKFAWDHASIPYDDPVWWDRLNQMRSGRNTKLKSEEEKLMVGYAGQMEDYLKRKEMYHLVILYEDLVEDPEREARKVFKLLGLSTEYMHTALEALKEDSQKGTFGPRGVTAHISDESFAKIDGVLRDLNCPIRCLGQSVDEFRDIIQLPNPALA